MNFCDRPNKTGMHCGPFNVNTEVRQAYTQTLRTMPASADLPDNMEIAVAAMKLRAKDKIRLFGSSGRAS
jgi:fructose/tagatose bisphosphate aldolase